jgi:hypothetical protein
MHIHNGLCVAKNTEVVIIAIVTRRKSIRNKNVVLWYNVNGNRVGSVAALIVLNGDVVQSGANR